MKKYILIAALTIYSNAGAGGKKNNIATTAQKTDPWKTAITSLIHHNEEKNHKVLDSINKASDPQEKQSASTNTNSNRLFVVSKAKL